MVLIMDPSVIQPFIRANAWLEEYPSFLGNLHNIDSTSDVFHEVEELIRGLNLEEFKVPGPRQDPPPELEKSHREKNFHQEKTDASLKSTGTKSAFRAENIESEVPSKGSEAVSNVRERSSANPPGTLMPARKISLSRPPETSISDVTISTKVTNMDVNYQPIKEPKKSRRRFSFNSLARSKNPNARPALNTPQASAPLASGRPNLQQKRSSLVGQNLPLYIQEQLQQLSGRPPENQMTSGLDFKSNVFENTRERHPASHVRSQSNKSPFEGDTKQSKESTAATMHPDSTIKPAGKAPMKDQSDEKPRQMDRIHNLLSNSESFHFYSDNTGPSVSQRDMGSPILEAELEYISPNSFTRSIEYLDQSYMNSRDGSADDNEYGEGSSSVHDDELFFSKTSDA